MSNAEVYLLLGLFMAAMFGAIIYFGQKGVEATRQAEHIVADENVNESFKNTDEKVSFKKPYLISVMLLVLFLAATYIFFVSLNSVNRLGRQLTSTGLAFEIFVLLVILSIAIFRLRYRVSIDKHSISIQGLFLRKIDFDEMCDLSVQSYRGLTSLLIESKTGKKVEVGSDLVDFLVFVQTATTRYEMRRKNSKP